MPEQPGTSRPEFAIASERNLPATMRDGVTLYADVYRPDAPGTFPVILMRVPYHKRAATPLHYVNYFAPRGYVVVVQDTRGRFKSEGEFCPIVNEALDGYDSVEWAAGLRWSNGNVGTAGQSYHAATQYQLMHTRPPHLRCQVPISAAADFRESWVYHSGGALELGWLISYAIAMSQETAMRLGLGEGYFEQFNQWLRPEANFFQPLTDAAYRHLPVHDWAERLKATSPYLADYLERDTDSEYWSRIDSSQRSTEVATPIYHIGSWYDVFQNGTLTNFVNIARDGREAARGQQKLLMGPWGHLGPFAEPTTGGAGEIDFGPAASIQIHDFELRWFDHWLKGIDTGVLAEAPVRIFVMGDDAWRDEQEWPLARTRYAPWYFHSGGEANGLTGDGTLSPQLPADEPADGFRYDPDDPAPTLGGNTLCVPTGVFDQRAVEKRLDVLCYTSAPLDSALEVTGPISVKLYAASSAHDTDFTAKLVVVRADGYARNLADGIVRARFRTSRVQPELIVPGAVYEYLIDLWATSYVFRPGERIRVEISSANFPRFDRNPNTGGPQFRDLHVQVAEQTVHHNGSYPSHILLPVIPR